MPMSGGWGGPVGVGTPPAPWRMRGGRPPLPPGPPPGLRGVPRRPVADPAGDDLGVSGGSIGVLLEPASSLLINAERAVAAARGVETEAMETLRAVRREGDQLGDFDGFAMRRGSPPSAHRTLAERQSYAVDVRVRRSLAETSARDASSVLAAAVFERDALAAARDETGWSRLLLLDPGVAAEAAAAACERAKASGEAARAALANFLAAFDRRCELAIAGGDGARVADAAALAAHAAYLSRAAVQSIDARDELLLLRAVHERDDIPEDLLSAAALAVPGGASGRSHPGQFVEVGDDGVRELDPSGLPVGPDGVPMRRGVPLNDWELLKLRRASVLEPAPWLAERCGGASAAAATLTGPPSPAVGLGRDAPCSPVDKALCGGRRDIWSPSGEVSEAVRLRGRGTRRARKVEKVLIKAARREAWVAKQPSGPTGGGRRVTFSSVVSVHFVEALNRDRRVPGGRPSPSRRQHVAQQQRPSGEVGPVGRVVGQARRRVWREAAAQSDAFDGLVSFGDFDDDTATATGVVAALLSHGPDAESSRRAAAIAPAVAATPTAAALADVVVATGAAAAPPEGSTKAARRRRGAAGPVPAADRAGPATAGRTIATSCKAAKRRAKRQRATQRRIAGLGGASREPVEDAVVHDGDAAVSAGGAGVHSKPGGAWATTHCRGGCDPARRKVALTAALARRASRASVTPDPRSRTGRTRRIMLDTGATVPYLTAETALLWDGDRSEREWVLDAQGNRMPADGGGALLLYLCDKDGTHRCELIAQKAYEVPAMALDLLSFASMAELGWDLYILKKGSRAVLRSPSGFWYPLEREGKHYYLSVAFPVSGDAAVATPAAEAGGDAASSSPGRAVGAPVAAAAVSAGSVRRRRPLGRPIRRPCSVAAVALDAGGGGTAGARVRASALVGVCASSGGCGSGAGDHGGGGAHGDGDVANGDNVRGASIAVACGGGGGGGGDTRRGPRDTVALPSPAKLNPNARAARARATCWPAPPVVSDAQALLHLNYFYYHCAFNHQDAVVRDLMARGAIRNTKMPPNFRCAHCEIAKAKRFAIGSVGREIPLDPDTLIPFRLIELDIYGPLENVNSRNGHLFEVGFICVATGASFLQPVQCKSGALDALMAFVQWVGNVAPVIEKKLNMSRGSIKTHRLRSDRDGSFTTTWGSARSAFDEAAREYFIRFFGDPGSPRTCSPHIERLWGTLASAVDASMETSGAPREYLFDAFDMANQVYNRSTTLANILGKGEAPFSYLGLEEHLERIVPFFNPCTVVMKPDKKRVVVNRPGRILGIGTDTPGYRVVLDPLPGQCDDTPVVLTSLDVTPRRNGLAWRMGVSGDGGPVADVVMSADDYRCLPTRASLVSAPKGALPLRIPVVQRVGAAPGDAGSRESLLPFVPKGARRRLPPRLSEAAAVAKVRDARRKKLRFLFVQENPKTGLSHARYEIYKSANSFVELWRFGREFFSTVSQARVKVFQGGFESIGGDFVNDVRRDYVVFEGTLAYDAMLAAAEPVRAGAVAGSAAADGADGEGAAGADVAAGAAEAGTAAVNGDEAATADGTIGDGAGEAAAGAVDAGAADAVAAAGAEAGEVAGAVAGLVPCGSGNDVVPLFSLGGDRPPLAAPPASVWSGRLRDRRLTASAAVLGSWESADRREFMAIGLRPRPYLEPLPSEFIRAAAAMTEATPVTRVPQNLRQAMQGADWKLWLAAYQKELAGLQEAGSWGEVERSSMPPGVTAARTRMLFEIKKDGTYKCRYVIRGDLTTYGVHYLEGKSSMAAIESMRMLVSFAAAEGWALYAVDFSQAFTNAPEENPHMYAELPVLPPELMGGAYGTSGKDPDGQRSRKVAHMFRNHYGEVGAGRVWEQYLRGWMIKELGVRFYINDRNAFEWDFEGQTLRGVVHVDDLLFAVSGNAIRAEFVRRLSHFRITGGSDEAEKFCGVQITRDWAAKTITLHQRMFAEHLMDKYGVWEEKPAATPWPVTSAPLEVWDGEATERDVFDFVCFVGDLQWYSRTNPGLAWRGADLARFMQSPGPDHVDAARHVLRYIRGHLDAGLTYHGSDTVLHQSYDHTHKLIAAFDAGFSHAGEKAMSGAVFLMNGAAVAWRVRRQSTVSNTTAEAEVKACGLGVEMLRFLTDLHGEMCHTPHGTVRALVDSAGCEAQIVHGMDSKVCASYKRSQHYCEDAVGSGLMWLDHVSGKLNPADLMTKRVGNVGEFVNKNGVVSGSDPDMYATDAVVKILADASTAR